MVSSAFSPSAISITGYNADELKELAAKNEAWDKAQVSIYKRKCGLSDMVISNIASAINASASAGFSARSSSRVFAIVFPPFCPPVCAG